MSRSKDFIRSVCFVMAFLFFTSNNSFAGNDQGHTGDPVSQVEGRESYVTGLTSGRAKSLIGVVTGLLSVIIGWRTKVRAKADLKRPMAWATTSLALGVVSMILSVVHLVDNAGGFGTGGGKAGAIVAILLGTTGVVLGGLALRSRRRT